ncbi:DASH complex subunit ask1 [Ophidiomyces ophidiicola]|nr:DASH complex subunit ask1 [Ophidiomyces ophidiicola]
MSRPAVAAQRSLSLTEELEKLEQQITLTLQEIDHNFSKAHRIVTTGILPVVEQYAEQSRDVWEASKVSTHRFWKQFFESSANVSLSGYEEQPLDESSHEMTVTEDSTNMTQASLDETSESYDTTTSDLPVASSRDVEHDMSSLSIVDSHTTPRALHNVRVEEDDSINYTLNSERDDDGISSIDTPSQCNKSGPFTPNRSQDLYGRTLPTTPGSVVFPPPTSLLPDKAKSGKPEDPVLHRVLDKTYRVQATPLGKSSFSRVRPETTTPVSRYKFESSPMSSPELEAPKLHSEIFSSPVVPKSIKSSGRPNKPRIPKPGISVLTPAKPKTHHHSLWNSDDDLDDDFEKNGDPTALFGSPPKTMQFHIPQSKLLKTPAKEASKRIVSDLLHTAGAGDTTSDFDEFEYSPSVVRRAEGLEDDTF